MGDPLQFGYDFDPSQILGKKRCSVSNFSFRYGIWAENNKTNKTSFGVISPFQFAWISIAFSGEIFMNLSTQLIFPTLRNFSLMKFRLEKKLKLAYRHQF